MVAGTTFESDNAVRVRLNKQGAIRGSRDVGILVERSSKDYDGRAS